MIISSDLIYLKDNFKQNTAGLRVIEPVELRPVDRRVASKIYFQFTAQQKIVQ